MPLYYKNQINPRTKPYYYGVEVDINFNIIDYLTHNLIINYDVISISYNSSYIDPILYYSSVTPIVPIIDFGSNLPDLCFLLYLSKDILFLLPSFFFIFLS